ncbi:MAG TPA: DUF4870 domain-containing protein [Anaerolineales bacterium]|jgi:hypothetical protein
MTTETLNTPSSSTPLSQADERTWAMLAHLSVLVNLFTGVLGPVVALVIYLMFANRSRYVAYHAMQSFLFQLVVWYGIGTMWGIVGLLSAVLIGVALIPFACLLTPFMLLGMAIAPVYGIYAAIQTSQGSDFQYWWVGGWVRNLLNGI